MHFELGILSINWNIYIFEKYLIHSWFLVILVAVLRIMLMADPSNLLLVKREDL